MNNQSSQKNESASITTESEPTAPLAGKRVRVKTGIRAGGGGDPPPPGPIHGGNQQ